MQLLINQNSESLRFKIEITETLQRTVEIDASNAEEAISKVKQLYQECEFVLDERDYIDTEFELFQ